MTDPGPWQDQTPLGRGFWIGCAIVLLGIVFLMTSVVQVFNVRALAAHGITIQANITHTRVYEGDRGTSYHLQYEFTLDGTSYTYDRTVPEDVFETFSAVQTFELDVVPDRPRIHDIYEGQTRAEIGGFFAVSVLTILFGLWIAFRGGTLHRLRTKRE
ncbi:MAG: DUF3592 domain-containing protein [Pseudomonadota bacterium]